MAGVKWSYLENTNKYLELSRLFYLQNRTNKRIKPKNWIEVHIKNNPFPHV